MQYYQGIVNGQYIVGQWVELLYKHIIEGLEKKLFFYDHAKAAAAVGWIEAHCYHTEGPLAPGPLQLELWQKAFISLVFGIVNDEGLRQFREVVLVVGRKNGKTKLCSAIASYIWKCEGFGARVYCVAPKLEQADLVYMDVWTMNTLDPEYQAQKEKAAEKDAHNTRVNDQSMLPKKRISDLGIEGINSTVKKLAFSGKRSDGFSPSLCVNDEIAAWEGEKGIRQYEVMRSGMGARPEAIMLSASTSGFVNDGIYDEIIKRSTRFLLGDSKEKKLLPLLYMIDDVTKWNDINELYKSMPNLGVSTRVDYMLEEIAVAQGSLSKRAEFLTKYCNIKQSSSVAFLRAQDVEAVTGEHFGLEDFPGCYCVAGLDLSQTVDLTAAIALIEKGVKLYAVAHFWMPAEKLQEATDRDGVPYRIYEQRGLLSLSGENFVDYHDVEKWFIDLVTKYKIYPLKTGYDRYSSQYLVKALEGAGYHMSDVYQGDNLWPCLQEVEGLIKDGRLLIGDNDLLKIHLLNSAVKMSAERGRGRLIKINPTSRIDGMAALLDAVAVRQLYYDEIGEQLKNKGK